MDQGLDDTAHETGIAQVDEATETNGWIICNTSGGKTWKNKSKIEYSCANLSNPISKILVLRNGYGVFTEKCPKSYFQFKTQEEFLATKIVLIWPISKIGNYNQKSQNNNIF